MKTRHLVRGLALQVMQGAMITAKNTSGMSGLTPGQILESKTNQVSNAQNLVLAANALLAATEKDLATFVAKVEADVEAAMPTDDQLGEFHAALAAMLEGSDEDTEG